MTRPLLILRPEPGAAASARAAAARGLAVTVRPLFEIVPLAWQPPPAAGFDALMLTSANAVRAAGPALAGYTALPVYAVGPATAAAARAAGFTAITAGDDDLVALFALVRAGGACRLLHLCGVDRRRADPGALSVTAVPVYDARAVDPPPGLADAADHVVLLHSPRAARHFAALVPDRAATRIAAISAAALAAAGPGWAATAVAARPDDASLLAVAVGLTA
ncbi:uroporphyrinogen-III synthase [Sphingomonas flavalba]|uniref:uroporphyrinogen-III synthase n=1 Tax=Sphingomonas flavalba TaxID=2559804 RepID=UPI0039DFA609